MKKRFTDDQIILILHEAESGALTIKALGSALFDATFGALTGFILGKPRITGINAGGGSDLQIFRQIIAKARAGSIKRIRIEAAIRMSRGAYYQYAFGQGAAAGSIRSTIYGQYGP